MKDFLSYVSPSAASGFICGLFNVNVWWTLGIVLLAQYLAIRARSENKKDDGQELGTVLGLSTTFFLPVGFVCFVAARALFK
jgi:hypothetical protein